MSLSKSKLRIAHTPDADDAFMFSGLSSGAVGIPGWDIEFELEDVQSLNLRAQKGDLDVMAVSAAAYPLIAERYRILSAGASVGRNYGPVLVAAAAQGFETGKDGVLDLEGRRVATPGPQTTATMLLHFYARNFKPVPASFEEVMPMVREGKTTLGLVIHEGQITFQDHGLVKILDLGHRWNQEFHLPIPLGLEIVRKDLGDETACRIDRALKESILWARYHREEALQHALKFGRGTDPEVLKRFVDLYVNDDTLDLGTEGKAALETLYRKAKNAGLVPQIPRIDIVQS